MNTMKSVFSKIAEDKTELAKHEVNLGAIDELQDKYKKIAANAPKIKAAIFKEASNLAAIAMSLGTIKSQFEKIEKTAKDLGVELPSSVKALGSASESLAKNWGKIATKIAADSKEI
ncbi:MAG: hypothetical protein ACPGXZ_00140 [Saprospiraceae bacterium]